jgi:hypothetical protein
MGLPAKLADRIANSCDGTKYSLCKATFEKPCCVYSLPKLRIGSLPMIPNYTRKSGRNSSTNELLIRLLKPKHQRHSRKYGIDSMNCLSTAFPQTESSECCWIPCYLSLAQQHTTNSFSMRLIATTNWSILSYSQVDWARMQYFI